MKRYKKIKVINSKSDVQLTVERIICAQKQEFDQKKIMKELRKELNGKGGNIYCEKKLYLGSRISKSLEQMVEIGAIKPTAYGFIPLKQAPNIKSRGKVYINDDLVPLRQTRCVKINVL